MKYLNEESQFTRVSDEHAKMMMESIGYKVPESPAVVTEMYACDERRFALCEEVVEADDSNLYLRLEELDGNVVIEVDESGREPLINSIDFEDETYALDGIYQDEDGGLFACMVSESTEDPGDEDEAEEAGDAEVAEEVEEAEETEETSEEE